MLSFRRRASAHMLPGGGGGLGVGVPGVVGIGGTVGGSTTPTFMIGMLMAAETARAVGALRSLID